MSASPLHQLARRLQDWAQQSPAIRALFWYGGYGYGQLTAVSDLDVAVLLSPGATLSSTSEQLVSALRAQGERVEYLVLEPGQRRLSAWTGGAMTKLDVTFGWSAEDLAWLADAMDVPAPRLTAAWPVQEPEVKDLLHRASLPIPELEAGLRRERGEEELDKFLLAFAACSVAHSKGDAYTFYFHYNLALGRLARVLQLTRVGHRHLYLPRNLLEGVLSPAEREGFRLLAGTLHLPEALERQRALAHAFLDVLDEARAILGVRRERSEVAAFIELLQRRGQPPDRSHP